MQFGSPLSPDRVRGAEGRPQQAVPTADTSATSVVIDFVLNPVASTDIDRTLLNLTTGRQLVLQSMHVSSNDGGKTGFYLYANGVNIFLCSHNWASAPLDYDFKGLILPIPHTLRWLFNASASPGFTAIVVSFNHVL